LPQNMFEITDPDSGKTYRMEADEGVTQEQALEQFQSLDEGDWAAFEYRPKAPAAPKKPSVVTATPKPVSPAAVGDVPAYKPNKVEVTPEDYELGMDNIGDFSPEEVTFNNVQKKTYLNLVNDPTVPREQIDAYLQEIGAGVMTDDLWQQTEQARKDRKPFVGVRDPESMFKGMVDEQSLTEEYAAENTDVFSQTGRSMMEAWSDPASLMNALDRGKLDFFDVYEEELANQFPDASPEELAQLEDQYIGYMARKRSEAASAGVKDDDFVPWLAGQFLAIEPYDVVPIGRVAKAGSKLGRAGEKFAEGAAVAAAGDVAGQALAINDYAQERFDPLRTLGSAAISGTLSAGGQALSDAFSVKSAGPDESAPTANPAAPIVVPTGKRNSKAYKQGLSDAQDGIVAKVNELASGWTNAPKIKVHDNFEKLDGIDNNALGVYTEDGTVMINTEAVLARAKRLDVTPESVVQSVTFHEALGHHGLTQKFGEELDRVLDVVYTNGTEEVRTLVDDWITAHPNSYVGPTQRVRATEEVLAEWAEKEGVLPKTFTDMLLNKIKNFARDMGMNLSISRRELRSYLAISQRRVTEGAPTDFAPGVAKNIIEDSEDARTPDTTSAGFKRPNVTDDRSRDEARKQLWKNKTNPDWDSRDPNGLPSEPKYMSGDEDFVVTKTRVSSYQADGKTVPALQVKTFDGKFLASVRRRPFESVADWEARAIEDAKAYQSHNKYMAGDGPIDPENLSADDLIETNNVLELLNRLVYKPTVINPDQLEAEALSRNLPPSDITRLVGLEPGKLMKRLFLYDVAATKLSDRAAKIKGDITENGLTPEKQLAYFETTQTLADLTQKIFDFQGEIGRTLAANKRVNFSRKRVRDLQAVLKEYGAEALLDPETFYRYMAEMEAGMQPKTKGTATFKDNLISYVNIPRAIMSSSDLSAPLRQGIVFIGNKEYWSSFFKMFTLIGPSGEGNYQFLMKKIATHPNYELMQKARVAFSSLDGELSSREEDFQTELARKIPGFGKVVKASEQAYAGFLNKLRADMFNKFVDQYRKAGIEPDEEMLKGLGKFINAGTGRAELPEFLRPSSTVINATFFSGRLMYSRVQMLNPAFYAGLPAPVRKQALKSMLSFGSVALLVNGAINALWPDEVETEIDPRSSDFLKLKVGDTRFDIGGGFNQYLILGARTSTWLYNNALGFGDRQAEMLGFETNLTDSQVANKKTVAGNFKKYGNDEYEQDTYGGALADFFRSKLSPQASYAVDAMVGTDYVGEEFTVEGSAASRLVPMTAGSVYDAYAEDSPVPLPVVFTASMFGVGVNTYGTPGADPDEDLKAPVSFEMKDLEDGENEFVRAEDGEVTLKKQTRDKWEATINNYYPLFVEQYTAEMGYKSFDEMNEDEKKAVIKKAKKTARANAKEDMMYELGLAE
jgi:hypothetical protein